MKKKSLSRRYFLKKSIYTGSALLGVGAIISACGSPKSAKEESRVASEAAATQETSSGGEGKCDDFSGVSDVELAKRESFGYVDETPNPETRCDNCQLWIQREEGQDCGGCMLFKGPVHDEGYCTYWAPQV